jgi:hypothetical protein
MIERTVLRATNRVTRLSLCCSGNDKFWRLAATWLADNYEIRNSKEDMT